MKWLKRMFYFVLAASFWTTPIAAHTHKPQMNRFGGPDDSHYSYFINGLASAVPAVGFGLRNLSQNLDGTHYSYVTPVESTIPIQLNVLADIQKRLKKNPSAKINLIGVSYGGNIATLIAQRLNLSDIPVNYLAVIDAPAPVAITPNVHRVDNFYCRRIGCIGQKVRLSLNNIDTIKQEFLVPSKHVTLSATSIVEERITGQLTETAMDLTTPTSQNQKSTLSYSEDSSRF